jgi:hypothetical protein
MEIPLRQFIRLAQRAFLRAVYFCVATGIASGLGYALGLAAALGLSVMYSTADTRRPSVASLPQCVEAKEVAGQAAVDADRPLPCR